MGPIFPILFQSFVPVVHTMSSPSLELVELDFFDIENKLKPKHVTLILYDRLRVGGNRVVIAYCAEGHFFLIHKFTFAMKKPEKLKI